MLTLPFEPWFLAPTAESSCEAVGRLLVEMPAELTYEAAWPGAARARATLMAWTRLSSLDWNIWPVFSELWFLGCCLFML